MASFLPTGYESLKTEKSYWKMSQMKEGDNRLRIVCKPIAGWLDWHDKKPVRYKPESKPYSPFDPEKPVKAFWSLYVWDYAREGLFILEISQSSLLKSLTMIANDEDWGDFTKYDIKINKTGNGKDTRYGLTPLPHKPLAPKIEEALVRSPVRLEALYEGKDPWTDLQESGIDVSTGEILLKSALKTTISSSNATAQGEQDIIDSRANKHGSDSSDSMNPIDELKELLEIDQIPSEKLEDWIKLRSETIKQPPEVVVKNCLIPKVLPQFKKAFKTWISTQQQEVLTA